MTQYLTGLEANQYCERIIKLQEENQQLRRDLRDAVGLLSWLSVFANIGDPPRTREGKKVVEFLNRPSVKGLMEGKG